MHHNKPGLKKKFWYFFDKTLSAGTTSLIGWLGLVSFIIVVIATIFVVFLKIPDDDKTQFSFQEALWLSLMRILDPGNLSNDNNWPLRLVMLIVTLAGLFVLSVLIGIITSVIQEKIYELQKGRSTVLEKNHIVILGWSAKIMSVMEELLKANEIFVHSKIVILAEKDKVEMEDEIQKKLKQGSRNKIICRTGNTLDPLDLERVSIDTARSIIILSSGNEKSDMFVIKTMLAIVSNPHRKEGKYHIVAEIDDEEKLEIARMVAKEEATFVYASDLIAKIILQSCRHSGLSIIYQSLLGFSGSEIYFNYEKELIGRPFREALFAYPDAVAIGICHGEEGVDINPDLDKIITANDRVIIIAENDSPKTCAKNLIYNGDKSCIAHHPHPKRKLERTLILGWNKKGNSIIQQIDEYVHPGSEITIVANTAIAQNDFEKVKQNISHQKISFIIGETSDKALLDTLNVPSYDHVVILGYSDQMDIQESDAHTLVTLLYLRQIAQSCNYSFGIISEIIDSRNRQLMLNTQFDDFIVSNKLISSMIAQLAENHTLDRVFNELFDVEGPEIFLRPVTNYLKTGIEVNFYTIIESAMQHYEIPIGYRLFADQNNAEMDFGIFLNPAKQNKIIFNERDSIIVIARE